MEHALHRVVGMETEPCDDAVQESMQECDSFALDVYVGVNP